MRVALVTNIASPYRLPTWNALVESGLDLRVLFCAESHPDRIWDTDLSDVQFSYEVLPGWSHYLEGVEAGVQLKWSVWRRFAAIDPERIVLTGFMPPTLLLAALYGLLHDIPVVCWWGTHEESSRFAGRTVDCLRRIPMKIMDGFLTYGTMATEYLMRRGVSQERIVTGTNTVDVDRIARRVDELRRDAQGEGETDPIRFLFVGQLIRRKGIESLVNAFAAISDPGLRLDIVGYGPLQSWVEKSLDRLRDRRICYHGGSETLADTCEHYARADCLVMPSAREVWGLVVNEALAAGLYVITSDCAGATRDLVVRAPINVGLAIEPNNERTLIEALERAATAIRRGKINRAKIRDWGRSFTPDRYARSLISALEACQ